MSISVIVATYGSADWKTLAEERAHASIISQPEAWDVVLHHAPDGTVSSSRNAGADIASGSHYLFVDADDQIAPGYIGAMEAAVEQQPNATRLLFTPAVSIVRNGRGSTPTFFRSVPLRQANWLVVGTLIHKDLFWEVGGFPEAEHGLEDWGLWSKCARVGAEVVKVPDAVYRYHANPQSMHRQLWRDKKVQRAAHARVAAELDDWEKARV